MISRRDILKTLPAIVMAPSLLQAAPTTIGGLPIIRYKKWEGVGVARPDHVDLTWAEQILAASQPGVSDEWLSFDNLNILRTRRLCYLPEEYADYFTASGEEKWKTDYVWYGPVTLVRDVSIRRKNVVDKGPWTSFYVCRTDDSIQGPKLAQKPWFHRD